MAITVLLGVACGQTSPVSKPAQSTPVPAAPTGSPAPAAPAGATTTPAKAGAETGPVHLRIASLSIQTGWYNYAASMAVEIRPKLPKGSTIDILPYGGALGNIDLVNKGEAELGLGFGNTSRWAYQGTAAYADKAPLKDLRALLGGLDHYYVTIVAKKALGISSLADLKAKKLGARVTSTERGSVAAYNAQLILEKYGITEEDLKSWGGSLVHTTQNAVVEAMRDGRADIFIGTSNPGHPAVSEMATLADVVFLPLDDRIRTEMTGLGYGQTVMPPNTFPKQTYSVNTIGTSTNIMVRADFPEPLARLITGAIIEGMPKLISSNRALGAFTPERASDPVLAGAPFHPGAEAYFRERGWNR